MRAAEVIRTARGVEVPRPGRWTIGRGHQVLLRTSTWRRRETIGRTRDGLLLLEDDPIGSSLELRVAVREPSRWFGWAEVGCRFIMTDVGSVWRFSGETVVDGQVVPATAAASYSGVYRHGGHAAAWFHLHARFDDPEDGVARGRHRHPIELITQLCASGPN